MMNTKYNPNNLMSNTYDYALIYGFVIDLLMNLV